MPETQRPADEPARDILAAEAYAVPAPDPSLHPGPIRLPEDPTGIAEPHDVLAAEEFPMPVAPGRRSNKALGRNAQRSRWLVLVAAGLALLTLRLLRRR